MQNLTPEQKEAFKAEIIKMSEGTYSDMMDSNSDLKAGLNAINEAYGIAPKLSRKLVKTHYDSSLEEQKAEFQEFEELCSDIFND